ncbi:MAG: hypothetical protein GX878_00790 [Firmicutes bacterium]|nr:hypothetical protein [Bacillota bacterium]
MSLIHHAALPPELIFQGCDSYAPEYLTIPFARGSIVVEPLSTTDLRIVRLMSSDLQDYLNPGLQPGRVINLLTGENF